MRRQIIAIPGLLVVGIILFLGAGCSTHLVRNNEETTRIGRAGVAVLVDSTVRVAVAGEPDAVSVPENAMIAVDMLEAARGALTAKGYFVSDSSLLTVGGQVPEKEKVIVKMPAGTYESPGSMRKPFIVRPEPVDAAGSAKLNALFLWARRAGGRAPSGSLDVQQTPGLILIMCAGGNKQDVPPGGDRNKSITSFKPGTDPGADAWSEVTLVALDRTTGKIVWQERGAVAVFTPEAVAGEVARLVNALPSAAP